MAPASPDRPPRDVNIEQALDGLMQRVFGVDIDDARSVQEWKNDLAFLRRQRERSERRSVGIAQIRLAIATTIVSGLITFVVNFIATHGWIGR